MDKIENIETILVYEHSRGYPVHCYSLDLTASDSNVRHSDMDEFELNLTCLLTDDYDDQTISGGVSVGVAVNGQALYEKDFGDEVKVIFYEIKNFVEKHGSVDNPCNLGFQFISNEEPEFKTIKVKGFNL